VYSRKPLTHPILLEMPYNALPVDVASGSCPEVRFEEVSHSTHRDWSRVNVVVLTDTTECPTTARHNFVSHEYYVFMTPLVSFRQRTAKGRSFSYFRDVD